MKFIVWPLLHEIWHNIESIVNFRSDNCALAKRFLKLTMLLTDKICYCLTMLWINGNLCSGMHEYLPKMKKIDHVNECKSEQCAIEAEWWLTGRYRSDLVYATSCGASLIRDHVIVSSLWIIMSTIDMHISLTWIECTVFSSS